MSTKITEYYRGKSVFITGGTGFIGKALLEKLLRSCPGVKKVYCLVRPKYGKPGSERLTTMFQNPLFDTLRAAQPDFQNKVVAIHGDMMDAELGISSEHQRILEENVNVIFHSAATVRFDEKLRPAVEMNIIGTRKTLELAKRMKNLEAFVHTSSAYANCDRQLIEEVIYPTPVEPQKLINSLEWMTDEMVELITPDLIGDKPNTYTYTKQIAETLLVQEGSGLPITIVRPSIVTASWQEPIPGWIDNANGPSGLYVAAGRGILRSMKGNHQTIADLVPVDLPVNLMLAAAWHTAERRPTEVPIYQVTTGCLNPFTWGEMEDIVMRYFKQNPLDNCFRRPQMKIITKSNIVHDYWVFFSHLIPSYIVDFGFLLAGKKPRMVKIYNQLHKSMGVMEYFTTREWEWTHNNLDMLKASMTPADQKKFYFDPRLLHWQTYMQNYCRGTKTYLLGESDSDLPAARAHLKKLRNIRYFCNAMMLVIMWRLLIARSSLARNSWSLVISLVSKFVRFFNIFTATMARS